ncbi:MAG: hypothetical protein NC390_08455 [Fusobacterium sp.]|nr:hypothetical protein [Fusobacterium sp.]
MSTADTLATLSYINAGLQCTNQYLEDRKENKGSALNNLFFNLTGSAMRIGMADHMAQHGNYWGYTMNSFVPYTDQKANLFAMASPMMFGGFGLGMGCMPMMPFGGFGLWGGGHHHHHCGGGGFTSIHIRC